MINVDPASDYRMQELLAALNEGLLEAEFVQRQLAACTGGKAELVHYSDGKYGIVIE